MKVCSRCKQEKSLSEFNKNKSKNDGYQYYCKVCQAISTKKHYEDNKEKYVESSRRSQKKLSLWFADYKKTLKCSNCGEDRYYCLDFHHLDPTKKVKGVSKMVADGMNKEKIIIEIDKCVVLCKNCHSEIHYMEKNK